MKCPKCGCKKWIKDARSGFIEVGEYNDAKMRYEFEDEVEGYSCTRCNITFWITQGTLLEK